MSSRFLKMKQICEKYKVKSLYVFGSRGMEMYRVIHDDAIQLAKIQSDFDCGVLTHSALSMDDKVNLTFELEALFGASGVDLFVLQEVDAFLAVNIVRGERVYAEDPYLADEYELFVLRRAGNLAEVERQRLAMILQEV